MDLSAASVVGEVLAGIAVIVIALSAIAIGLLLAYREFKMRLTQASEAAVQLRVKAAPLRLTTPTEDGRNTQALVRPTSGDTLTRASVDQLTQYLADVNSKDIRRKLTLEYRDGEWQPRNPRDKSQDEPT